MCKKNIEKIIHCNKFADLTFIPRYEKDFTPLYSI
jgi:hypothetical protein